MTKASEIILALEVGQVDGVYQQGHPVVRATCRYYHANYFPEGSTCTDHRALVSSERTGISCFDMRRSSLEVVTIYYFASYVTLVRHYLRLLSSILASYEDITGK